MTEIKGLLTIPFFYPHKGGAQKYAEELLVHLAAKNHSIKIDVLCYNTDNSPAFENYRGLNIYRVSCITFIKGKFVLPRPLALFRMLKNLAKEKYSFVNTHTAFFDTTWWTWIFARKIGAVSIFTGHAPGHPVHHIAAVEWVGKLVHLTIAKFSLRHYDIFTYANTKTQTFFENELGVKKQGTVVPNSVDPKVFSKAGSNKSHILRKHSLSEDDYVILYVGRMIETKGIRYLYEAILMLKKQLPFEVFSNLKFIFAGPGDLEVFVKDSAKQDGLLSNIQVLGAQDYSSIAELMSICQVFVSPSSHAEGLPTTLVEAGACGCIVISTDSGSISDVIRDHETGLLIEKKNTQQLIDSIKWILENKTAAELLATNLNRLVLTTFTWDVTAAYFNEILLKALQEKL